MNDDHYGCFGAVMCPSISLISVVETNMDHQRMAITDFVHLLFYRMLRDHDHEHLPSPSKAFLCGHGAA